MDDERMPWEVMPPGRTIKRELEARGWTQKYLAELTGYPRQTIRQIIHGEKEITSEIAAKLSKAFGVSKQFWINLETNYRKWLKYKKQQDIAST
jgi:HTH-type transcriptional regulator/antitoxin HigA